MKKKTALILILFSLLLVVEFLIIDVFFYKETSGLMEYDPLVESLKIQTDTKEMENILSSFSNVDDVTISLIESDGTIIYQSDNAQQIDRSLDSNNNELEVRRDHVNDNLDVLIVKNISKPSIITYNMKNIFLKALLAILTALLMAYFVLRYWNKQNTIYSNFLHKLVIGEYIHRLSTGKKDMNKGINEEYNALARVLDLQKKESKQLEEEFNTLLKGVDSGILSLDKSLKVLRFNEMAEKLLHLNPNETLGEELEEITDNPKIIEGIKDSIKKASLNQSVSLDIYNRDIEVITHNIHSIDKQGYVIELKDVTEANRIDQVRRDFVSNVSHELKTPITSIKGFTETLLDQEVDPQHQKHFLSIIHTEVERMEQLISDLFVLTEAEKIEQDDKKKTHFSPYDELEELMIISENLKEHYPAITLEWKADATHRTIFGNPYSFRQMVLNLIVNALKYSKPEGGLVKIKAYNRNRKFILKVSDQGIGIDEKDVPRIFERFFRAERSRSTDIEGTGLGLAIVKHIVVGFGGTITVQSKRGIGSEFKVEIPSRDLHGINL